MTSPFNNSSSGAENDVMRITAEEAASSHVDDLLRRHASLRGDQGITRDRGRKWYYQSWFILMIAGCAAALAGYALINPYFGDYIYVQGVVTSINPNPKATLHVILQHKDLPIPPDRYIEAQVGGRPVAFAGITRVRQPDGNYTTTDPAHLKEGQVLGAYVMYCPTDLQHDHSLAIFIDPNPKPRSGANLSLSELSRRQEIAELLLFPTIAAFIGLFIGAADGVLCRLFRRVLLAGAVGLIFGLVGGFFSGDILADQIYDMLSRFAESHSGALGFSLQTAGRGLAWALAGMTMGLGQGIALRSSRLLLYGFLGGLIGGLLGGLLFDPIDFFLLGGDKPSASLSRWIGFGVIGAVVGLMIGIVERLARDAWLRMTEGPLAGKEFLVFKDVMRMGSSPKSEIYLFNDPAVAGSHAIIRATGDIYEIENTCRENPACLNGRPVQRSRLRHGDRISLGRTSFLFQRQRPD